MSWAGGLLKGRRVIITAGASGIGLATAQCFVEAGAAVHICDVADEALAQLKETHPEITGHHADVGDAGSVARFLGAALDALGGVDTFVNNAGIGGPAAPLEAIDEKDWERTIGVNLNGPFYCLKHVVPLMKAQRSGSIINISTASTITGLPNRTPYTASKMGVEGLTYTLAREVGPFNIRCNAILPGWINNARGRMLVQRIADRTGKSFEETVEEQLRYISMRTMIDMHEIGDLAVFLASDAARHISGQMIAVDGLMEWEE